MATTIKKKMKKLGKKEYKEIMEEIKTSNNERRQLILTHQRLTYKQLNLLCQTLSNNNSLTSIDISHNTIEEFILVELVRALQNNITVRYLDIRLIFLYSFYSFYSFLLLFFFLYFFIYFIFLFYLLFF